MLFALVSAWSLFGPSILGHAALINVTINDTLPDPITGGNILYEPVDAWNSGADCERCTARPNPPMLYSGTWHDSTFNALPGSNNHPNETLFATALFQGTAVYVFCVLARTATAPTGNSDMSFLIDKELAGTFVKQPLDAKGYDYNVAVYSNTSLKPGNHQITIQNRHVNGAKSLIILDSIVYTHDNGTLSGESSNSAPVGAIVGGIVGGLVFVGLAGVAFFLYLRRRARSEEKDIAHSIVQPFTGTSVQIHTTPDISTTGHQDLSNFHPYNPQRTDPLPDMHQMGHVHPPYREGSKTEKIALHAAGQAAVPDHNRMASQTSATPPTQAGSGAGSSLWTANPAPATNFSEDQPPPAYVFNHDGDGLSDTGGSGVRGQP